MIFFGAESLRRALDEYVVYYHEERNHQGKGNALLFPADDYDPGNETDVVKCRERLGGMLILGIDHRFVQIFRSHKLKVCDWIYNYLILPNFQFATPFGYRYS